MGNTNTTRYRYFSTLTGCALAACLLFFVTGLAFLRHLGLQNDEALFAGAIYEPKSIAYLVKIGHSRFPLMMMSYLGTVKSWLYKAIFSVFGTGILATRRPMLLSGTVGVWLFYLLLQRVAGRRAAIIGCGLL